MAADDESTTGSDPGTDADVTTGSDPGDDADPSGGERFETDRRGVLKGALFLGASVPLISSPSWPAGAGPEYWNRTRHTEMVSFTVNGRLRHAAVEPRTALLDVLRRQLNVTGPKRGCDRAACGFCTVLLDDEPVYACSVPAIEADGREVVTIEGLGTPEDRHPLQEAFISEKGMQCGYCTPGHITTAFDLLRENPDPTREEIHEAISGVLCNCGNHPKIVDAIETGAANSTASDMELE